MNLYYYGEEKFTKLIKSSKDLYYKLIVAALRKDLDSIKLIIENLECFPLSTLKLDYERVVLEIIKVGLKIETSENVYLNAIINVFNDRIFNLIDILNDKKIFEMFTSDKRLQSAMYILIKNILIMRK